MRLDTGGGAEGATGCEPEGSGVVEFGDGVLISDSPSWSARQGARRALISQAKRKANTECGVRVLVEDIGLNVVALARMLLGEGAQHHQSLFTSRNAVSIVVVQVVSFRSNQKLPSPQNAKPLNSSKRLAPGTGVGAPTCGCLANHG